MPKTLPSVPPVVRTFGLKYASAADTVLYQNGQPVTVPGMATMLTAMLGDGSVRSPAPDLAPRSAQTVQKLRGRGLRGYGGGIRPRDDGAAAAKAVPAGTGGGSRGGI